MIKIHAHRALAAMALLAVVSPAALAQDDSADSSKQPNILVLWGDDIGQSNISAYTFGVMGYQTPNIDRIAREGVMFTDYYGEQSCTAGRSSFIMGQSVFRTGLSKVGLPGAKEGMQAEDPTIATVLKAQGYATGQFGKNHLGDRDEHLPTEPRLRRVLRQPLPLERRGRAGAARLPEGSRVPQEVRSARRDQVYSPTVASRTPVR